MAYILLSSRHCKAMFYIGNTVILISGLIVLVLGILMVMSHSAAIHSVLPEYSIRGIGILFIIVGLSIAIAACVAFYAAFRENRCLMVTLIVILIVLFFIELVGAVICIFYTSQDSSIVTNRLSMKLSKYYNKIGHEMFTRRFDELQRVYECCGAYSYLDWLQAIPWKSYNIPPNWVVPLSCCRERQTGCNHRSPYANRPEQLHSLYHVGCSCRIRQLVGRDLTTYGYIVLLLFFVQLISLTGLCAMVYHLDRSVYDGRVCRARFTD